MKSFSLVHPTTRAKYYIVVDDDEAYRLRSQVWHVRNVRAHPEKIEIHRHHNGVTLLLTRVIARVTDERLSVVHLNLDCRDFRRENLMPIPRHAQMRYARAIRDEKYDLARSIANA